MEIQNVNFFGRLSKPIFLAISLILVLVASRFFPFRTSGPEFIVVTGEAEKVLSNQVLNFNVNSQVVNEDRQKAYDEAGVLNNKLAELVKEYQVEKDDVQTDINVYEYYEPYPMPIYDSSTKDSSSTAKKWQASFNVRFTLRDISKRDELMTKINSLGNITVNTNFGYDEKGVRDNSELLASAVENARKKAESMAKAGGRRLGKVLNVSEGSGGGIMPMYDKAMTPMSAGMGGGGGVEMFPGSTTSRAFVTATFELK